jgi:hypothetical protein
MKRAFKTLALVFAITAMGAVASSAAQATAAPYTCLGQATCIITSEQTVQNVTTFESGIVKCTSSAIAQKTVTSGVTSVEVHPECSGVKAFGVSATMNTTGCNLVFPLETGGASPTSVVCSGTNKITINPTGIACEITVGSQTGINGISFANMAGTPADIKQTVNATNIAYTETGTGCHSPGTHTNGRCAGTYTIKGYDDVAGVEGVRVGIAIE